MPAAVPPEAAQTLVPSPAPLEVVLRVNGADHRLTLDPRTTLLDGLREHLHLTGAKKRAVVLANAAPARSSWTASA